MCEKYENLGATHYAIFLLLAFTAFVFCFSWEQNHSQGIEPRAFLSSGTKIGFGEPAFNLILRFCRGLVFLVNAQFIEMMEVLVQPFFII